MAEFDVLLRFNENSRRLLFLVTINDDELLESIEQFNLELKFDLFTTQPSLVILEPNVTTIYIQDDDGNFIFDLTLASCY